MSQNISNSEDILELNENSNLQQAIKTAEEQNLIEFADFSQNSSSQPQTQTPKQQQNTNISNNENQQTQNQQEEQKDKQQFQNMAQYLQSQQQQVVQIIDVAPQYQKGNFGPMLLCLHHKFVDKEWLDGSGYNVLHHAACYNNLSIVKILVEYFKIDPNIQASNKQTCLMITTNFGFLELMRYFLSKNADINILDNCNFNALLYAVKSGHTSQMIYLINKGSNIRVCDVNGCGIVHWAAYKSNMFYLRFFKKLQMDLSEVDRQGFTPFQRAIHNDSYDAIEFLYENNPNLLVDSMDLKKIESTSVREYLEEKRKEQKGQLSFEKKYWKFHEKNPQFNSFCIYMILTIFLYMTFFVHLYGKNEPSYNIFDTIFNIFTLYFIAFVYCFIFKIGTATSQKIFPFFNYHQIENTDEHDEGASNTSQDQVLIKNGFFHLTMQEIKNLDFTKINNLLHLNGGSGSAADQQMIELNQTADTSAIDMMENERLSGITENIIKPNEIDVSKLTFLHYVYALIENGKYLEAQSVDYQRYCPTCLKYKVPKTKHCSKCDKCIPHFNHHSYFFGKCINLKNHFFYLCLLFLQQLLLILYIFLELSLYAPERTSWQFLMFFETSYLMIIKAQWFNLVGFLLANSFIFYNSLFLFLELYGICINQTQNELFNRHRYRYLFEVYKDRAGKVWTRYKNKPSLGLCKNIIEYFKKSLYA